MLAVLLIFSGIISRSLKEITEPKSSVILSLYVKYILSAPGGIRTHGLSLRKYNRLWSVLSISDDFSGSLTEIIGHYVDICRFMSLLVDG